MLLIATIHGTVEQTNNDGEILKYCELLTSHPLQATRFNVTKFNAQQFQKLEALKGQEVIIGLEQRKTTNGANYWQMTQFPEPRQPVTQKEPPKPDETKPKAGIFNTTTTQP